MTDCKTKYPIILVHGMGARDRKKLCYWGRIPGYLRDRGASVFFGNQDSNACVETNSLMLKNTVNEVLERTGAEKVNIIAHSKGGLEARYMISNLNMADKTASLTTMSTPHNGSKTMDAVMKIPAPFMRLGSKAADLWFRLLGDSEPDTYDCLKTFTTAAAERFNAKNPDAPGVYYRSFAFAMRGPGGDLFMAFPYFVVRLFEGENDGLLAPDAVKWTNFRGIIRGAGRRGISHCHEVDMYRRPLPVVFEGRTEDLTEFYADIVSELREMGF